MSTVWAMAISASSDTAFVAPDAFPGSCSMWLAPKTDQPVATG